MLLLAGLSVASNTVSEDSIVIEGWDTNHGAEIPILRFNSNTELEPITTDIKAESVIEQEDGSMRFKLSHSTPFGRRDFANVTSEDLGNGSSKVTITNIADGKLSTFITSNEPPAHSKQLLGDFSKQALQSKGGDGSSIYVVPIVPIVIGGIVGAINCMNGVNNAANACIAQCATSGGVKSSSAGLCGSSPVCECWNRIRN